MIEEWFLASMRCPACGSNELSSNDNAVACASCSETFSMIGSDVFVAPGREDSASWRAQQQESVARYMDEEYNEDKRLGRMFGGFVAATFDRSKPILDIGVGPLPGLPDYIEELSLEKFGAIEPLEIAADRPYPCLLGAKAEALPFADHSFDGVMFATSLDHIEEEDAAMTEVKRVLKPDGRIYIWNQIFDPESIAQKKTFDFIFVRTRGLKRLLRMAGAHVEYFHLWNSMRKRRNMLTTGARIDHAHTKFYTNAAMTESVKRWGLVETRRLQPPGEASIYVELRKPG